MIYVEDELIKLNGVVLPGLVKSIEVIETAKVDEQEVEGSATTGMTTPSCWPCVKFSSTPPPSTAGGWATAKRQAAPMRMPNTPVCVAMTSLLSSPPMSMTPAHGM